MTFSKEFPLSVPKKSPASRVSRTLQQRCCLAASCAAAFLVATGSASAQTNYFWTGSAGGFNWSTPGNWNTPTQTGSAAGVSPGNAANDGVTINLGSAALNPVLLNTGGITTIGTLNLGSAVNGSAFLHLSGAGTVLSANAASFNVSNGAGSTVGLTIDDGAEMAFNPGAGQIVFGSGSASTVNIVVGNGAGSTGTLRSNGTSASITRMANQLNANVSMTVNAGGSVILPGQFLVGSNTNSTGALYVNGGLVSTGGALVFGQNNANSILNLTSGTVSSVGNTTFGAASNATVSGGLYTLTSGFGLTVTGSFNQSGGVVSVGTGFTINPGGVATMTSGSLVGTGGGTARLTVSSGSMSISGGVVNLTGNTSTLGANALLSQSGGSVTLAGFTVGNASAATYQMSGGTLSASSITVSSGSASNGTVVVTGGTITSGAGLAIANGSTAVGGQMAVAGPGTVFLNSTNGAANILMVGTNSGTGAAGTLMLQGATIAPAAGATNGYNVALYTPGSLTSAATASTIQGYGTLILGSTGTKTFTNGGRVVATGANLVSDTGATPVDHTLDLTGSSFTVVTTANRAAGAGWYAVNHGMLMMNVSGTATATTLNWGAPSGAFSASSLLNSVQLTMGSATAPSGVSISLLAADRTDVAALFGQAGLPAGPSGVIGLWEIDNTSGNTWTGLTMRYDDALAGGQTPSLYYIADASSTWTLIDTTVDQGTFVISDNVASLDSGYYALIVVPEPGVAGLLIFGLAFVARRRRA